MRYIRIEKLEAGMILGKTLMSDSGRVLLHAGVELRPSFIEKIGQFGFAGAYVDDDFSKEIEINDIVDEGLRFTAIKNVKSVFEAYEREALGHISSPIDSLKQVIYDIIDQIIEAKGTVTNIVDLQRHDDYTFRHSVNVAIISIILATAMGNEREWLFNLGMAALFHDIGKMKIPLKILNKPGALTAEEFDEIKKHSRYGFDYVKSRFDLPAVVYVAVLEHHEKYNGGGYPEGLSGEKILKQARIIAVADVYDAVTSKRPYGFPMEPAEAFDLVVSNSSIHFDPEVVGVFARTIAPYPIGSQVVLSDGLSGIVVKNYEDCILRPLIKLLNGANEPSYVDLKNDSATMNVTITGLAR